MRKYHLKKLEKEPLYNYDPWKITEKNFKIENNHHNETVFSLGNGYIGLRGTLEEDYTGLEGTTTPGFYLNGVYASESIIYGEEAPKQPEHSQTILNLPDWTIINLYINGEKFGILSGKLEEYTRYLDLKEGTLNRSLIWESSEGKKVKITICRFLSATRQHIGVINYQVEALNFTGSLKFVSALNGDVHNYYHLRNPKALSMSNRGFTDENKEMYLDQEIRSTDIRLATTVRNDLKVIKGDKVHNGEDFLDISIVEGELLSQEYTVDVSEGDRVVLNKYMSIYHSPYIGNKTGQSCDEDDDACLQKKALEMLKRAYHDGFQRLLDEHISFFEKYWQDVDIKIDGDTSLQQGMRYNALQLFQSTGRDGKTNIAAKGLTGEFYEGHYFWDTETYVIPFYLFNKPEIARSLLIYRYNILDKARENARRVRTDGALFPWRTINGEEASAFFMGSTVQFHINADIAYAIYQYFKATGDKDFIYEYGTEILIETARMWASRGCYIPLAEHKYCFNEVCGPDEYKPGVSNNCYTNYMARFNLEYAVETVRMMKEEEPELFASLADRVEFEESEADRWEQLAEDIFLPYNKEIGIHPQDDSFLYKDQIDIDSLDEDDFPLVANWHPLTIWRYQVIKQADVILLMFLLGDKFTIDEKRANYDYYEPRTTHDSSLSPSIYSIIASEIGYYQDAYDYFIQTVRLDLDDFNGNTWKGLHLAAMGSSWLALVYGFARMRNYQGQLSFSPYLPDGWDSYQFRIRYKEAQLEVVVKKEETTYSLISGRSISFSDRGTEIELTEDAPTINIAISK